MNLAYYIMDDTAIIIEKLYRASISRIWRAITDKDQMKEWYFTIDDFELKQDSVFNFYVDGDKEVYHHQCIIKEIIPEKKLSHTWTHPSHSNGESLLTWILQPTVGGTKVTLTHQGVDTFVDAGESFTRESFKAGWNEILKTSLREYLSRSRFII